MALKYDGFNLINQPERLFTVRPRSTAYSSKNAGNRGTRARLRVLTTDINRSLSARNVAEFSSGVDGETSLKQLLDTSSGGGYTDFLLTNVSVNFSEKVQITQTYGDSETVYYFGKAPVIFNLAGMLIDDMDNQWFIKFVEMYTHVLRGSESARNYELVQLVLPNMIVLGSIMSMAYNQDANSDTNIPFSMQMHAKEIRPVPVILPSAPISNKSTLINFKKAETFTDFTKLSEINSTKTKINDLMGAVQNPLGSTSDVTAILSSTGTLGDNILGKASSLFNTDSYAGALKNMGDTGGHIGTAVSGAMDGRNPFPNSVDESGKPTGGRSAEDISNALAGDVAFTGAVQGAGKSGGSDFGDEPAAGPAADGLTTASGFPQTAGGTTSPATGASLGNGVPRTTQSPTAFRSTLFSPVFGVLTSVTKVVNTAGGDITKIISSFTNPINTVLRDIQGIAKQAIGIVTAIENNINKIVHQFTNVLQNIRKTISSLRRAAGVISRAPKTIKQIFNQLFKFGSLKSGAAFLTSGGKKKSKIALLHSGKPYTPASGSSIR